MKNQPGKMVDVFVTATTELALGLSPARAVDHLKFVIKLLGSF